MKYEIIKTENYLLAVDDSEIKEGDYRVNIQRGYIKLVDDNPEYYNKRNDVFKKVIAHLPLNNAPVLEGVELLPPLEPMHLDVIQNDKNIRKHLCVNNFGTSDLEKTVASKSAEITEQVAIEFGNFLFSKGIEYYDDLANGVNYTVENKEGIFTMKELFQEFLKTKQ